MKKLLPWIIVTTLGCIAVMLFLFVFGVLLPDRRRFYSCSAALSSIRDELYLRELERSPGMLHLLAIGVESYSPVPGVMIRNLPLDPIYKDDDLYALQMWSVVSMYNYVTLARACHIALQGEDSPRVRYVLKADENMHADSYESTLLRKLDSLHQRDESARELFSKVKRYGLGRVRWRIPRKTLLGSLENADLSGLTLLSYAVANGNLDLVASLIDQGADVNERDDSGRTALMFAANYGHLDVVKYVADKGADVNARDTAGWTPLMRASLHGHLAVAKFLVERDADVNAKTDDGITALSSALDNDHMDIVNFLKEHGAKE